MEKLYDTIDKSILKSLPNPATGAYEIKIKIPEFTFLGVGKQPDFATVYLTFYPQNKIIELKSLKGGISSKLTIDSDWGARGGKERYNDWKVDDVWEVTM